MRIPKFIFTCLLSLLSICVFSQEICNNGIDDDGDGFIDCYDSDCANNSACNGTYLGNDVICQAKPTSFPKFTMKLKWQSPNKTTNHLNRASVGDLDKDGIPEVVVNEIENKYIYILNGNSGTIKKSLKVGFSIARDPLIGNVDKSNCAWIFVSDGSQYVYAFDCNLNLKWQSTKLSADPMLLSLADFDNDGKVELYCRDEILAAESGIRIVKGTNSSNVSGTPVAVDILDAGGGVAGAGDNKLELVSGGNIYSVNLGARTLNSGSLTLKNSAPGYFYWQKNGNTSHTSIADYNQDGFLDVIATGSTVSQSANATAFFWDVKNNTVKTFIDADPSSVKIAGCSNTIGTYYKNGWQNGMGRINIADLDGDGKLNASFISGKYLYALDENWNDLSSWPIIGSKHKIQINEETSGYTGCTVYDFNGDGANEVVYRDEQFLYIINGNNGSINTQQQCIARTNFEYPIVSDVDGDGQTELCVTCGFDDTLAWSNFCSLSYSENSCVRIFQSATVPWVPARRLWNQHAYFNVNVNDDLTIPQVMQKQTSIFSSGVCTISSNRPLNSFLNQSPYLDSKGCPTYASPDLFNVKTLFSVQPPTCPDTDFTVTIGVQNVGDATATASVPVTFYNGDPTKAGATKLNTVNINVNLTSGQTQTFSGLKVTGTGGAFKLYIALNDGGTTVPTPIKLPNTSFLECNYDNVISADVIPKSVKITANKIQDDIKCFGSAVPDNGSAQAYINVAGVPNTVDYNFYWSNGAVAKAIPGDYAGSTYTGLAPGTYRVYARHKTAGCSSDTATVTILQSAKVPALTASIVVDQGSNSCGSPNGKMHAVVNNNDPITNYTFAWYEGNDIFTSPQIGTGATASNLKGGKTYTVLVTDNVSGCQSVASLPVPDNTVKPAVDATSSPANCVPANSGSATATANGIAAGYTFNWYKGTTIKPTPDFTGVAAAGATYSSIPVGTYTVQAVDNTSGCSDTAQVSVQLPPPFKAKATMTSQQTSCNPATPNGAATAAVGGVTAGYTFTWFKGQSTLPANSIPSSSSLATGIYTTLATNNSTGCTDTAQVTITQKLTYPVATLTPTPNSICSNVLGSSPYTGTVTAAVTYNGVAVVDFTNYQLVWHQGALVTDPVIAGATGTSITQLNTGPYTLVITRTDLGCTAAPVTSNVTNTVVLPVIQTSATGSTNCVAGKEDGTANVTNVDGIAVASTTNYTYTWAGPVAPAFPVTVGGNNSDREILKNLQGGAGYNYTVTVTNKTSGCQNTASVNVPDSKVLPLLSLTKVDNGICNPALTSPSVQYSGSVTATVNPMSGGINNYTFVFGGGMGAGVQLASPNHNQYTQLNGGATAYTAQVTQQSTGCVSAVSNVVVNNSLSLPVITTGATGSKNCVAGSEDGTASVTNVDGVAVGAAVGYTYAWTGPAAPPFPVNLATNKSNSANLIKLQGGLGYNYTVTVVHQTNGCQNTTSVNVPDSKVLPVLSLSKTDNAICNPALTTPSAQFTGTVTATVNPMLGGITNYTFVFGGGAGAGVQLASPNHNQYTQLNGSAAPYTAQATQISTGCVSTVSNIVVNNTAALPVIIGTLGTGSTNCVVGKEDGKASVTNIDSGVPLGNYTFVWTGPAAFPVTIAANDSDKANLRNLQGGSGFDYSVLVTRKTDGCQNTATVNVPDSKALPVLTLVAQPTTVCDPAKTNPTKPFDGQVSATVNSAGNYVGNVPGDFTFTWSTGLTGVGQNILTNQDVGSYSVSVVHTNTGCQSSTASANVTSAKTLPAITMDQTPSTNCAGGTPDGVAKVLNVVPNGKNYDYKWFDGNSTAGAPGPTTLNTTATTNNYSGVQGGLSGVSLLQYTVEVTILQTGCQNTATVGVADNKSVPILGPLKETDNTNCTGAKNGTAFVNTGLTTAVVYRSVNQVSPYAGFTFNWTGPSGYTGTGSSINSLAAGTYSLTTTNTASNCTSNPVTVTVNDNLFIPVIKVAEVDQTSCDITAPNGSLTASVDETSIGGSASVTAGYTFTWLNTVTSVTTVANAITNQKGNQDYKVTVVRTSTGCTNNQTDYLKETLTIPTVTAAVTDMTTCSPYNGKIVATPAPGAASDYDYFWYDGSNAPDEQTIITNNNPPSLVGTLSTTVAAKDTYGKLIPGDYAVVVRDKTTKCASAQLIKTVNDKTPAINPEAENTKIPAFCNAAGGELTGAVRLTPSIVTFTANAATDELTLSSPIVGLAVGQTILISRDGSNVLPGGLVADQTYIISSVVGLVIKLKDALNNPIDITSNGVDGIIADFVTTTGAGGYTFNWYNSVPSGMNPALPINYYTNPPNFAALTASPANPNSVYSNIQDGLYTLEVTDNTTGCKNFVSHTLPFQGSHAVIKITKSNSTFCAPNPDNGSITIRIEDPTTGGPFVPDNYTVTLKQGATVVAGPFNPVDPFNVSGTDFVVSNTLSPGTFIVTVQQNYGSLCALDQDVIIGRDALPPVVDLTSVSNNACDNTKYNGQISIKVSKDPADLVVAPITYDFNLSPDPNLFSSAGNAAGTYLATGLSPQPYTFIAKASTGCTTTKNITVLDAPKKTQLTAADVISANAEYCTKSLEQTAEIYVNQLNLIGGGVENLNDYRFDWVDNSTSTTVLSANGDATANNGAGGDELINIGLLHAGTVPAGTVWKDPLVPTSGSYTVTATKVTDSNVVKTGGIGCASTPFTVTIAEKKINPQITLTPTGNSSCTTAYDGIIKVDVTTASGPGSGATYDYAWTPTGALGQPGNSAGNSGIGNNLPNLADGNYSLVATNNVTGCFNTLSTSVVRDAPPVFTLSASVLNETNCGPFDGEIDISGMLVDGTPGAVADFDYVWYRSNIATAPVLDGTIVAADVQLAIGTYPAIGLDKYFVKGIRKAGGKGIGCESAPLRKDILDDRVFPTITLTSTPSTSCDANYDGSITVVAVTTGFPAASTNYSFDWTSNPATTTITDRGSALSNPSQVFQSEAIGGAVGQRIGQGQYDITVTNLTNQCAVTGSINVLKNTVPFFVSDTVIVHRDNCVLKNGSATVTKLTLNGVSITGASLASDYDYVWNDATPTTISTSQATGPMLDAGNYTVVVTKKSPPALTQAQSTPGSGCSTPPLTVTIQDLRMYPLVSFASTPSTSCDSNFDGSITVTAVTTGFATASTNYNFDWTANPATTTITDRMGVLSNLSQTFNSEAIDVTAVGERIGPGQYDITVTNLSNQCTGTGSVNVQKNTVPFTVVSAPTNGRDNCVLLNGSAGVTALSLNGTSISGASLGTDFTYVWKDASATTVSAIQNTGQALDVGDYTVVATKKSPPALTQAQSTPGSGCSTPPFTVTIDDLRAYPQVSFTPVENTACDTNFNGSITVTAITFSGPGVGAGYNFVWTNDPDGLAGAAYSASNSPTANTASPYTTLGSDKIGGGAYDIRVTNATTQCFSDATVTILDDTPDVEILTASKTDQMICNPDGSIQVQTLNLGVPSDYTFTWYASSPASSPLVDASSNPITGSQLQIGGAQPYPTMQAGTYFVTAKKGNNPGSGCVTAPFKVDVLDLHTNPAIASATPTPDINCPGSLAGTGAITINEPNPGNYTFAWFVGNDVSGASIGSNSPTLSSLQKGNYTVRETDNATNCSAVSTYTVDNNPTAVSLNGLNAPDVTTCVASGAPSTGFATVTSILENGTSGALGNYTFTWVDASNNSVVQSSSSPTVNNLPVGNYTATALNTTTQCSANFAFTITDKTSGSIAVSLIDFGDVERCVNPKTGFLTAQGVGSGASYSYEWYPGDQRPMPAGVPVANTAMLSNITVPPGQSQVTYTVKAIDNTSNCWAVDAYIVPLVVNPIVIAVSSNPRTFCPPQTPNGEAFVTVLNGNPTDYFYYWGNGNTVNTASPDYTGQDYPNIPEGTYTAIAVDKLDPFCVSPSMQAVVDKQQPTIVVSTHILNPKTYCTSANGDVSADVDGNVSDYIFEWYQGPTATGTIIFTGPELGGLADTDYTVHVTDKTSLCVADATVTVPKALEVVPNPTVTVLADQTSCLVWSDGRPRYNGKLSASVNGVTKDYVFDWAKNAAPPPIDFKGEIYDSLNVGSYTVRATSRVSGCESFATGTIIEKKKVPEVDFLIQGASCNSANGFISMLLTNGVAADSVIIWYRNGVEVEEGPNLENAVADKYTVKLITKLGCEVDKDVVVPTDILAYNGISRNADGNNDYFLIECIENFPQNHVEIFNRAGTKVYEADHYDNANVLFDGNSNRGISIMGTNLPSGTYFYVITKGDGSKSIVGYLELVD